MRKRRETFLVCTVPDCGRPSLARELCQMHYWRWRERGDVGGPDKERPGGSRFVAQNGYVKIHMPDHPSSNGDGYILEHRLVMERILGRHLKPSESVHHKNGLRGDNRPDNLELWVKAQPSGRRVQDLVDWVVSNYREEVIAALD